MYSQSLYESVMAGEESPYICRLCFGENAPTIATLVKETKIAESVDFRLVSAAC
jgi:hypothetical protein